jgi:hypothetical protein
MIKPTGLLNKEQHHSEHSAKRSEHYHAKIIGQVKPGISKPDTEAVGAGIGAPKTGKSTYKESFNSTKQDFQSKRPGLTANL